MEDLITASSSSSSAANNIIPRPTMQQQQQQPMMGGGERRARPQKEQALNCPRCNSTNTKFCYYNNYSLTQPRYFCKTCRRYWTEGGSLRNVPVGGGSRKNKRHSSACSPHTPTPPTTTTTTTKINTLQTPPPAISGIPPTKPFHGQDLNLAFPNHSFSELIGGFPAGELSAMELLRSTGIGGRGLGSLVQMSMPEVTSVYGAGFGLHDFGPTAGIKYPLDGIGGVSNAGDNGNNVMQEAGGRLLFPFGDLKPVPMKAGGGGDSDQHQQSRGEQGGEPPMFWAGANLGAGGGSW